MSVPTYTPVRVAALLVVGLLALVWTATAGAQAPNQGQQQQNQPQQGQQQNQQQQNQQQQGQQNQQQGQQQQGQQQGPNQQQAAQALTQAQSALQQAAQALNQAIQGLQQAMSAITGQGQTFSATDPTPTRYTVDLEPIQANLSDAHGTAELELTNDGLAVEVEMQDVVAGQMHPQHIHGFMQGGNFQQGPAANATCPTAAADTDGNGLISLEEGAAVYGPVLLPLDPFPVPPNQDYLFQETYNIDRSQLMPLENRVIVVHGTTIQGNYMATLPIACGEIRQADDFGQRNDVPFGQGQQNQGQFGQGQQNQGQFGQGNQQNQGQGQGNTFGQGNQQNQGGTGQ